jgi:hypothetical protein
MAVAPRCNSMRISWAGIGPERKAREVPTAGMTSADCSGVGVVVAGTGELGLRQRLPGLASASITHLRTMFAFRPLANATPAMDTPGCRQACTTWALNSGACRAASACLATRFRSVHVSAMK